MFQAGSDTESRVSNLTTESKKREGPPEPVQSAPATATPPPSYTASFRDHTIARGGAEDDESTVYSQPLPIPSAMPHTTAPTATTTTRAAGVASGGAPPNQYAPAPAVGYHELDPRRVEMMHRPPESPSSPTRSPQSASQQGTPLLRMTSSDALQIGLLLSQQEAEFGVNMYDSLENSDENTIRRLVAQGYTNDEAVLEIFNRKYGKTGPQTKWSQVSAAAPVVNRLNPPTPAPVPGPSAYQYQPEPPVPPQYRQPPPPQPLHRPSMYAMGPPPTGPHQSMYMQQQPMPYDQRQVAVAFLLLCYHFVYLVLVMFRHVGTSSRTTAHQFLPGSVLFLPQRSQCHAGTVRHSLQRLRAECQPRALSAHRLSLQHAHYAERRRSNAHGASFIPARIRVRG